MTAAANFEGAIAFIASSAPEAQLAEARLGARYGCVDPENADVIVALGGDGFMLQTLHRFMNSGQADLRHEPRLGRLPHERVPRG